MEYLNLDRIPRLVSRDIGFNFVGRSGVDKGERWLDLFPEGYPEVNTFKIRVVIGWRHFEVLFKPGVFSSPLLEAMRKSDKQYKSLFNSIVQVCANDGADIKIKSSGKKFEVSDSSIWDSSWENLVIRFRLTQSKVCSGESGFNEDTLVLWISRMTSAVFSLMPLESQDSDEEGSNGFPEGARKTVVVNRYERDPRNRAAAIAIHGCKCFACGLQMSDRYGDIADGFIEIHHLKPLHTLGEDYCVDPYLDLIPLCPNCHSIVHRRSPQLSLDELKIFLEKASTHKNDLSLRPKYSAKGAELE